MGKVINVEKIEYIERIVAENEIKKLRDPEGRDKKKILKQIKHEKEQEKLKREKR